MSNSLLSSFSEHIRMTNCCLADCKTPKAKKTFLTKDIKQQEEFLKNVESAVAGSGWYMGEKWYRWDLHTLRSQLSWSKKLRQALDEGAN